MILSPTCIDHLRIGNLHPNTNIIIRGSRTLFFYKYLKIKRYYSMAFTSTTVDTTAYTKIGDNVSTITFQCQSGNPIVINYTATDSAPAATDPGYVYEMWQGEVKRTVTDLSNTASAAFVWARALTSNAVVVHEGA